MSNAIQRRNERHCVIGDQSLSLRVGELPTRLGDRAPKFARGLDPFIDHDFSVRDGFGISLTVGHAAGEFGNFDNETVVVLAPVNDQFVPALS